MALIFADRVRETTTTTGTGSYALAGAVTGFRAFSSVAANADTAYYAAADSTNWEVGLGTWATGNTLARTTILASSNAGSAVSWGAGTREIFLTAPGSWLSGLNQWSDKTAPTGTVVGTSDSQTISAKTLINPTVTNYTETLLSSTGSTSIDLTNGTLFRITTNGSTTITLPSSVSGKSYLVIVAYGGVHTLTWAGGSTIKWDNGTTPTPTSVNGKFDIFSFFCDGTNTYGCIVGQNY